MRILLILAFIGTFVFSNAQVQTHLVTLTGDSVLYSNSKFRFVEFIDARKDTTKLGLLKENYNSKDHQLINFPTQASTYIASFINSVVDYSTTAEDVSVVIKSLEITEEPLGAIEIAKSNIDLHFYLKKHNRYKLIKVVSAKSEKPNADVTSALSSELELLVRTAFHEFLTQPGTEGENNAWLSKKDLIDNVIPLNRIDVLPIGELDYNGFKYLLNEKKISRKKALGILKNVDDNDINELINKNRKNFWASTGLSLLASGLVAYPIYDYVTVQDEFKGNYIMFGSGSAILALLASKAYRDNMREAVDLYNERYNE
ncbi:MAG: hypothetical protein JXQ87_15895 [Bacteroidia bacterium]